MLFSGLLRAVEKISRGIAVWAGEMRGGRSAGWYVVGGEVERWRVGWRVAVRVLKTEGFWV